MFCKCRYTKHERAKEKLLNHLRYFIVANTFTSSIALNWIERIKERIKKQERRYSERIWKGRRGRESETRWVGYVTEIDRTRVAHTRGKRRRKSSAIKSQYTAELKSGVRFRHWLTYWSYPLLKSENAVKCVLARIIKTSDKIPRTILVMMVRNT